MSACGAMGPSMVAFLKQAYGRAKDADKFLMSQQPALKYTRNTLVTSSFWDMRLSIACAATDAEFQNRIIQLVFSSTSKILSTLFKVFLFCENEAFAHTPSLQLCILVYARN